MVFKYHQVYTAKNSEVGIIRSCHQGTSNSIPGIHFGGVQLIALSRPSTFSWNKHVDTLATAP
jgi:hypothetical protein